MTSFQDMPDNARIWIYQSSRELSNEEAAAIRLLLNDFIQNWTAHKAAMKAHADVILKRLIIILADESVTQASGCSIDASVRCLKEIQQRFKIDLFDRLNILYVKEGNILSATKKEFEQLVHSGQLDPETVVFNNLINTKKEFEEQWQIPLKQSWFNRLFSLK